MATAVVAVLLFGGCASAPPPVPLSTPVDEATLGFDDADVRLSVARLSRDQVLNVLGPHGRRLSESATVLEITVTALSSPASLSASSFRLRLPTGETVEPLEPKWVLAAMALPGDAAPSGRGNGGTSGPPVFDEPDSIESAVFDIALVSALLLAYGVYLMIENSKNQARLRARAAVRDKVALPRTVERGATARVLAVYWPRYGRVPAEVPLPLEVEIELTRCTWRAEIVIPADECCATEIPISACGDSSAPGL